MSSIYHYVACGHKGIGPENVVTSSEGIRVIRDHPECTAREANVGFGLHMLGCVMAAAILFGRSYHDAGSWADSIKNEAPTEHVAFVWISIISLVLGFFGVLLLNLAVLMGPFIVTTVICLTSVYLVARGTASIRGRGIARQKATQKQLTELQENINKLRQQDPEFDAKLKSLDVITTALHS